MFLSPPINRSANNCIYNIWYLSDRYCYLPLDVHTTLELNPVVPKASEFISI